MKYRGYNFKINGNGYYHNSKIGKLSRYKWTQLRGPIPEGYVIHHKDEVRSNDSIKNLQLLTLTDHTILHKTNSHLSDKAKELIRKSQLGEKNSFYNRSHSYEAKAKIALGRGKRVICIETKEEFISTRQAAKKYGKNVSSAARNEMKTASGLHWKYI